MDDNKLMYMRVYCHFIALLRYQKALVMMMKLGVDGYANEEIEDAV